MPIPTGVWYLGSGVELTVEEAGSMPIGYYSVSLYMPGHSTAMARCVRACTVRAIFIANGVTCH